MVSKAHKENWDWEYQSRTHNTQTLYCTRHSLTIQWDGKVYADAISKVEYGNPYDSTLSEMWQTLQFH